jgi:hypothetical protein
VQYQGRKCRPDKVGVAASLLHTLGKPLDSRVEPDRFVPSGTGRLEPAANALQHSPAKQLAVRSLSCTSRTRSYHKTRPPLLLPPSRWVAATTGGSAEGAQEVIAIPSAEMPTGRSSRSSRPKDGSVCKQPGRGRRTLLHQQLQRASEVPLECGDLTTIERKQATFADRRVSSVFGVVPGCPFEVRLQEQASHLQEGWNHPHRKR